MAGNELDRRSDMCARHVLFPHTKGTWHEVFASMHCLRVLRITISDRKKDMAIE